MPRPVVSAVINETQDPSVREAMLLGSYLEGGWGPGYGVGDQGHSFGPYQINLPFHPGVTREQAEDPEWATDYMYGRYVSGVLSVNPTEWVQQPMMAAEKAAYRAEMPAKIYHESRGWGAVNQAWQATVAALREAGEPVDPGSGGGGGSTGTSSGGDGGGGGGNCDWSPDIVGILNDYQRKKITLEQCQQQISAHGCDPAWCKGQEDVAVGGSHGVGAILGGVCKVPGISVACDALGFVFSLRFLEIIGGGVLILLGLFLLGKQLASSPAT